jgi:hypothetical protein
MRPIGAIVMWVCAGLAAPLSAQSDVKSAAAVFDHAQQVQHFRYSDTFLRVKGEWRVVHVQVTALP